MAEKIENTCSFDIRSKTTFSFDIPASMVHTNESIYTPPFATTYNMYWQLHLKTNHDRQKKSTNDPTYHSLTLNAIPNPDEEISSSTWDDREKFSATIFMKNPYLELEHGALCDSSILDYEFGIENFVESCDLPKTGHITIGVLFDDVKIENEKSYSPLPSKPWPEDLIDAWSNELNQPDISDIQFIVDGAEIYGRSSILSRRSEYFRKMIDGGWTENNCYSKKDGETSATDNDYSGEDITETATIESSENTSLEDTPSTLEIAEENTQQHKSLRHIRYKVNVTDVHQDTFLEMLRYLYTNNLEIDSKSLHRRPIDIFIVADKYLIPDLRQLAKSHIYKDLTVDNAAEILFGQVYKWNDLKNDVMKYVATEFSKIRKTSGYQKIVSNPVDYPMAVALMSELLKLLVPDDEQ
ncbi:12700_t:CDS:2 [Acaulospora colombiana]|uniref:12700_t:CDS:1 n=1 Tax=Acaulospora colombiana TaxID=27376 RepID=A0ACA9NNS2_9GLOM|nr:12700_t:CDS:2 [Acaulospora colombiana]